MESNGDTNSSLFDDLTKKDEDKLIKAMRRYKVRLLNGHRSDRLFNSFEQLLHDLKEKDKEFDIDVSWHFLCWLFNSPKKDINLTGLLLVELSETTPTVRHRLGWPYPDQFSKISIERYSYIKELVFTHIEIWNQSDHKIQILQETRNKNLIATTHASNSSGTYTCRSCKAFMSYREPLICNSCLHKGGSGKDPDLNAQNNHNYGDFGIDFDKY